MVKKDFVNTVISVSHVSNRTISIRKSANPINLSTIQVYSPTTDYVYDDDEIEE